MRITARSSRALAFAGVVCLGGCASVLPPQTTQTTFTESDGVDSASRKVGLEVLTVPEGQRVMLVKSPEDRERVCSPRESDQGLSFSEGLSLGLPGVGGSGGGSIGGAVGDHAVALGSPTAVVQMARELLFRACELSLNLDADAAATREIYERFLLTLERIAPVLPAPTPPAPAASDEDDPEE